MKNLFLIFVFTFTLMVEILPQSFSTGKIGVTLSGAGRVRVFKDSTTGVRQIDRSSILVGTSANAVFGYNQDAQNVEPVFTVQNPQLSDFEVYGAADNSYNDPPLPPHVRSKTNIYGWTNGGYLIVKYRILNNDVNPMNAVIGMEIIPQVNGSYGLESMKWLTSEEILSIFRFGEENFTGYKILSSPINTVTMIDWYAGYDTVDTDLWNWITSGTIDTSFDSGGDGSVNFISQNAVNIPVGDSSTFWLGIAVGNDEAAMVANMNLAQQKYSLLTSVETLSNSIPDGYTLEQNYPNPFNPETSIRFSIPQQEFVLLKVFNSLGQEVASPVNKELQAGTYNLKFDGSELTSGFYFYTITAGNFTQTKKMILMR